MQDVPESEKRYITIDEILPYIGEFQRFQWLLGILFCLMIFPSTYPILIMVFAAMDPGWRCADNSTVCLSNKTFSYTDDLRCSLPRDDWEFSGPKIYSVVTWFDIYCGNSYLIELSTSIFFIGNGIGGLLVGWVADNFGRRNVIFISTGISILIGFITAFTSNIHVFIILRFATGFFTSGTAVQMAIMLSELVASRYRPHAGILIWLCFPVALCLLSLQAYFIRNWQLLFVVCSIPYIFLLAFYKFTPESPRWLRLKGKMQELVYTLERIARINRKTIPSHLNIVLVSEEVKQKSSTFVLLFNTKKMAKLTLIVGYGFFMHGLVYYGLSMTAGQFGSSIYLNFLLLSLVEIPATAASIFLSDKFGRKRPTIICVFCAGLSCTVIACLPLHFNTARVVVGLFGKAFITLSFNSFAIWAMELVPTFVRSQVVGFNSLSVRLGSGAAPWVTFGLTKVHHSIPYICMAVSAFICSVSMVFLFETKGLATLETMEDLENLSSPIVPVDAEENACLKQEASIDP